MGLGRVPELLRAIHVLIGGRDGVEASKADGAAPALSRPSPAPAPAPAATREAEDTPFAGVDRRAGSWAQVSRICNEM